MFRSSIVARATSSSGGRSSVSGMIVTVFGSTGFLGRYVVNKFGRIGSQVVLPYRGDEKDFEHLKVMGDVGQIVPIPCHARHQQSIETAVSRSNIVVNLIGSHYDTKNFTIEQSNIDTASRIAEACARSDNVERLIYMSSVHAAPDAPSRMLRAKYEAEQVTRELMGSRATVIRSTQLFGDEDRFLNRLGQAARYWPVVPRLPDRTIAPVYVADAAEAIVAAARQSHTESTYELEGPNKYDQQPLFEELCRVMKQPARFTKLPSRLMELGVKMIGQTRMPAVTEDEWKSFTLDDVAQQGLPGFQALNIVPTHLEDVAINTLRKYRTAEEFYEVDDETAEQAAQEAARFLAAPDFARLKHPYDVSDRKTLPRSDQ